MKIHSILYATENIMLIHEKLGLFEHNLMIFSNTTNSTIDARETDDIQSEELDLLEKKSKIIYLYSFYYVQMNK